MGTVPYIETP